MTDCQYSNANSQNHRSILGTQASACHPSDCLHTEVLMLKNYDLSNLHSVCIPANVLKVSYTHNLLNDCMCGLRNTIYVALQTRSLAGLCTTDLQWTPQGLLRSLFELAVASWTCKQGLLDMLHPHGQPLLPRMGPS
jgi:hypothetical protein